MHPPCGSDDTTPDGVRRALTRAHLALLTILVLTGGIFVLRYRSVNATLLGYSWGYLIAVVVPWAVMALGVAWAWLDRASASATMDAALHRRPCCVRWCAPMLVLAGGLVLGLLCPEPHAALAWLFLAAGIATSLWSRATGSPRPLLVTLGPLVLGGVLMAGEAAGVLFGPPEVLWGDRRCFHALFPEQPPFIGPGGRLLPDLDARMPAPEYPRGARLQTNHLGLRNTHEFRAVPAPGTLRVLSLGDSFATGYAADQSHFFGSLLEAELRRRGVAEVLCAEVSDPAYGLVFLQQHGLRFQPRVVLYGLCTNDVLQAYWYAGPGHRFALQAGELVANPIYAGEPVDFFARFRDLVYPRTGHAPAARRTRFGDGLRRAPNSFRLGAALRSGRLDEHAVVIQGFLEEVQAADGHLRLLDGSANVGLYLDPAPATVDSMLAVCCDLVGTMAASARNAGARFVLVLLPQRIQVHPADWAVMCERWGLDPADFDLEKPNRRLREYCAAAGIEVVDPLDDFRRAADAENLYLPAGDVHYNRRGHEVAARAVAAYLGAN